ncbi:MAG: ABC transporter substrate-binding protein [Gammaproteobacteria bacterium]|nr:ABC transporter substrate-binding protein [Gammaproteobacteria bacterium]
MKRLLTLIALALLATIPVARAADMPFRIGYLEWSEDPRYRNERIKAEYPLLPWGRPFAAAEQAIKETAFSGSALKLRFELLKREAADATAMVEMIKAMVTAGVHYVIVDADGAVMADVAKRTAGLPVTLFNIAAQDDALRGAQCSAKLLHVIPNHAMLTDALAQYLVLRRWSNVLVLQGPLPADAALAAAWARSAKRLGLKIVDTRPFKLGLDPRERELNNLQLLTGSKDYDAVFVADTDGEFARNVPYQTAKPRIVVGASGLVADAWHWSWERDGARQLNNRLLKAAGRHVTSYDWAAWMAVKSIVEAVIRAGTPDYAKSYAYLRGPDIVIDGFKGFRMGYRPWDGQLRQPILLNTGNYAIAVAPIEGFLDPVNNLDTLGFDARETACPKAQALGSGSGVAK